MSLDRDWQAQKQHLLIMTFFLFLLILLARDIYPTRHQLLRGRSRYLGQQQTRKQEFPGEGVSTRSYCVTRRFLFTFGGLWLLELAIIGSIRSGICKLRSYVDQRTGHLYQSTPSILQTTKASNRNDVLSLFLVGGLNSSRMIVPMR